MDHDTFEQDHRPAGKPLFNGFPIISDQITSGGIATVWTALETVLKQNIPGDIVEFGCYIGTTSLFVRRLLDQHHESSKRAFHVYDSFQGLPEKYPQDTSPAGVDFTPGKLFVGKKELLHQFRSANLEAPIVHKGWFNELSPSEVPDKIAFAFLDGDFYESIISSLRLVWPVMQTGSKILVDDYQREALPGVTSALRDFFQAKPVHITQHANIAIISL
jgi:O-methyltransferase